MKRFLLPGLEREKTVSFQGIPEGEAEERIRDLDRKLRREIRKNEIRETLSIRFASGFISTPPVDDT